jgi:hypothetical protein
MRRNSYEEYSVNKIGCKSNDLQPICAQNWNTNYIENNYLRELCVKNVSEDKRLY